MGVRINIAVGDVTKTINNENQLNSFPSPTPSLPPNEVFEIDEILDSPRGILTQEMIDKKEQYPHHNPMMYKKTERVFLDNILSKILFFISFNIIMDGNIYFLLLILFIFFIVIIITKLKNNKVIKENFEEELIQMRRHSFLVFILLIQFIQEAVIL